MQGWFSNSSGYGFLFKFMLFMLKIKIISRLRIYSLPSNKKGSIWTERGSISPAGILPLSYQDTLIPFADWCAKMQQFRKLSIHFRTFVGFNGTSSTCLIDLSCILGFLVPGKVDFFPFPIMIRKGKNCVPLLPKTVYSYLRKSAYLCLPIRKCVNKRLFRYEKPYKQVCKIRKPEKNTFKADGKAKFQS